MDKEDYRYQAVMRMLRPEEQNLPKRIIHDITEMYFKKYTAIPLMSTYVVVYALNQKTHSEIIRNIT